MPEGGEKDEKGMVLCRSDPVFCWSYGRRQRFDHCPIGADNPGVGADVQKQNHF